MEALEPFRDNTRRKDQPVDVVPFTSGGRISKKVPEVGMLSKIFLFLRGTMNLAAGGALTDLGPWSLIDRISFKLNLGSAEVWDCTGYGTYIMNLLRQRGYRPDGAGPGGSVDTDIFQAGVASGNNTWNLTYVIQCNANDHTNFETGLINMQAEQVTGTIDVRFGTPADAVSNVGTGFTGNLTIAYEYFELPDPQIVQYPPPVLVRTLEEVQPISQTGKIPYEVPRLGTMMQLAHIVRLNNVRSNSIDQIELKFNKSDSIDIIDRFQIRQQQREHFGIEFPTGVFIRDFFGAFGDVSEGDGRDFINTMILSTTDSIVQVSSGATLGSNNNFLHSIRRVVQPLQVPSQ